MNLLEVSELRVVRGGNVILEDVQLAVQRGSIHCLAGPNGAGKSTLLSAVLGQLPFEGRIELHLQGSGRVGLVPQTLAVDRSVPVTVVEFLALSRARRPVCFGVRRALRARLVDLLRRVDLEAVADRQLSALSGGELQRVLLANALDPMPELLVLDEPAASLDAGATAQLEAMLRSVRDEGVTILMVSHDLGQIRRLADRVTILSRRVVADAPPDEALSSLEALLPLSGAA